MITRVEVDGFKSLQGFAVDLEPFTAFIGPNGAGKSNILEAMALLSRLASQPIVDAFRGGRGRASDQFSRFRGEVAREIRFAVEFLILRSDTPSRFRYELIIARELRSSGTEQLIARHEELRGLGPDEDAWIVTHPEFAGSAFYGEEGSRSIVSPDEAAAFSRHVHPRRTFLAHAEHHVRAFCVSANLSACQWLRLDLTHLAGPSDRVDTGALRPDGSNLPTVLADLASPLLGEVRADLVALVPGLSSFDIVPEAEGFRVDFELSGGERLPARLVSDGTLRLLALLAALRLDPRPDLVGIEEPENGIYPGRLRALVELLRQETERRPQEEAGDHFPPTQILLTTHSPVILAALRNHPQHLRFVDTVHRDGRRVTRARTVGQPTAEARHLVVSPREVDQLLNVVTGEGPE